MHRFLLEMNPKHTVKSMATKKTLPSFGKARDDFPAAMVEAQVRLGFIRAARSSRIEASGKTGESKSPESGSGVIRSKRGFSELGAARSSRSEACGKAGEGKSPESGSGVIRSKRGFSELRAARFSRNEKSGKTGEGKSSDGVLVSMNHLEPLAVLLQELGIPADRTRALFNSLSSDFPDGKVPVRELAARVRTLLASEGDSDGRVLLDPQSRLHLESALTRSGLSPRESDRVLSRCSNGHGEVEVEKFLHLTTLKGKGENGNPALLAKTLSGQETTALADGKGKPGSASQAKPGSILSEDARVLGAEPSRASAPGTPYGDFPRGPESPRPEGTVMLFRTQERKGGAGAAGTSNTEGANRAGTASSPSDNTVPAKQPAEGTTSHGDKLRSPVSVSEPPPSEREQPAAGGFPSRRRGDEGEVHGRNATDSTGANGHLSMDAGARAAAVSGPRSQTVHGASGFVEGLEPAENPVPAHVTAQVSKLISRALENGVQTIRMNLNPPELGTMKVQLEWSQDALRIEMVTDRLPVKEMLLGSVPDLKEALADQGFRVEKMEVVVNDGSDQPLSHSGRENANHAGQGMRPREDTGFSEDQNGEGAPEQPHNPIEGHLIDMVA